ncbi:MAG: RNA polymerase sigma factor [Bryobacteraceae bacterium]
MSDDALRPKSDLTLTDQNISSACRETQDSADLGSLGECCAEANLWRSFVGMTVHERVERIYESERDNIYAYLVSLRVPADRAQELTQESFLKLYLKMARGEAIESPRAWLFRVAYNFALRFHQREPVFEKLDPSVQAFEPKPDPELELIERDRTRALARAIEGLSAQQRNCLHLRVQGLRYREIADVIGISSSAVGEFLRRAVVKLKEALDAK